MSVIHSDQNLLIPKYLELFWNATESPHLEQAFPADAKVKKIGSPPNRPYSPLVHCFIVNQFNQPPLLPSYSIQLHPFHTMREKQNSPFSPFIAV